jgi:hypothetical protein
MHPIIVIDNVDGVDSAAASGSIYPYTAVYGTRAIVHAIPSIAGGTYQVAFLDTSPDLSGVKGAIDPFQSVLYIEGVSVSGRKFSPIRSVRATGISGISARWNRGGARLLIPFGSGNQFVPPAIIRIDGSTPNNFITQATASNVSGADVVYNLADVYGSNTTLQNVTVTVFPQVAVEDNMFLNPTAMTERSWAIGGRRKTIADTNTRRLFTESKPGWTIRLINNGAAYAGGIYMMAAGKYDGIAPEGSILIEGRNGTSTGRIEISTDTDLTTFELAPSTGRLVFKKIKFRHGSTGSKHAFNVQAFKGGLIFDDCEFQNSVANANYHGFNCADIDATLTGLMIQFRRCYFHDCYGYGAQIGTAVSKLNYVAQFIGCYFKNNNAGQVRLYSIRNALFLWNILYKGGKSIVLAGADCGGATILQNTIDGGGISSYGVEIAATISQNGLLIRNNIICRHTQYGVYCAGDQEDGLAEIDYNCMPTDVTWKNTQGSYSPYFSTDGREPIGEHDITASPALSDPENDDFMPLTLDLDGKAYPTSDMYIGMVSATRTTLRIGAVQAQKIKPVIKQDRRIR